jgi:hypothetical protein
MLIESENEKTAIEKKAARIFGKENARNEIDGVH